MSKALTAGLVQLSVSDDPERNLPVTRALIREAAQGGASWVLTPEATNLLGASRERQEHVLHTEAEDPTLAALREDARDLGIWLLIGSLSLKTGDPAEVRFANRSFLIAPDGDIRARYDKLHMFDVTVSESESYRESAAFRPGERAVLAKEPLPIGMTVCYDLRFPQLYRALAKAGAEVLTVPAAFNDTTGAAHWEVLLRARAIETGCFVLAPAQCGTHANHAEPDRRPRRSHGHSLAVGPWGEVLADGGTEPGVSLVTLDPAAVLGARSRIPSLTHDRNFAGP
ncbi:carbon-nitrogen hydrolase family protein [Paracoccus denitrificans]|jgi:predicted amidohydrolase|uniref:Nitrilase/cyanide hydratase and apolipoprotein N-acyltransferase n=1 Tax=Paracoccus denitrificans (strain Pd 1222) TaxID=318586 RepID=A1B580_PARDP|nr:carbon-nitrogen hydrolase family protein [Paracoccus denitrificans]ABL70674.1 Nitrilase/cyanide hydratase and apolipoprotein N-acyltransferase [Paracoccus denitrificans PD1222]MBB4627560.1 putative amidohydrolase [Paracoccus denitrificans]MCU7429527.1 carbon-nitrogen hydrolase family protein [Paracoccus denitrificans]UPV94908.1 carbon-nitrogen hydrolase family protein [Paracoccus denitrificans]WQO33039.1 carbon-nitrogen hydrolase family protein [Paracoccus denitrificans]